MNQQFAEDAGSIVSIRCVELATPARGAVRRRCVRCGWSVWIAPTGQRLLRRKRIGVWCLECVAETGASADSAIVTDEVLAEIVENTGWLPTQEQLKRAVEELLQGKRR